MKRFILFALVAVMSLNLYSKYELDKTIPNDPSVVTGTFENGLKYYIKENKRPKGRAEIQILVYAGSNQEDEKQLGLAHFIEHMAFNGTKNFPKSELVKYLESTGMSSGGDINASTSTERVYYTLQVPTDDKEMLSDGFQVLRDWLTDISFEKQMIEDERGVIIEEWRSRSLTANGKIVRTLFENVYEGSKWADPVIGDTNIINNAPREDFVRYFKDFYRPDISAIICVGDFDKDEILTQIKEKFETVEKPKSPKPSKIYPIPVRKGTEVIVQADEELQSTETLLIFDKRGQAKEGTYAGVREGLVQSIIPIAFGTRLQELLAKDKLKAQGGSITRADYPGEINPVLISVSHKEGQLVEGMEDILKEVYRVKQHGFSDAEVDRMKALILTQIESMAKDKDNMQSGMFASELSRNFMYGEAYAGIEEDYNMTKYFLNEITANDVNDMYNSWFGDYGSFIFHFGPKDLMDEKTILATIEKVKKMDLEPWVEEEVASSLMESKPTPGKITNADSFSFGEQGKDYGYYDVTTYELSNGAKVKLMKTDNREDEVRFRAYSPGGNLKIENIEDYRTATLGDAIVNQSGIGEHDITALQKILTGKKVNVSPSIGDMTENLFGNASPDDLEEMFQLIHLYFTSPRYDEVAVKSYMDRLRENVKNSSNNPQSVFQDSITAVMYNNHPRQFNWTAEMIDKIDTKKAFEMYKDRFADASDFTFYFVGNFDDVKINDLITTYLASLPSTNRKETWTDRNIRRNNKKQKKVINIGNEPNASIRLSMTNEYDYSSENNLLLASAARALSILLLEEIREKRGGVYSIGAWSSQDHYPVGEYEVNVQFGCDPERVDELVDAIMVQIDYLKENKLDEDYMSRVTEVMKSQYKKSFESNNFWLGYLYSTDWNKTDVNRIKTLDNMINNLTAEDIQKTAKKYFDTNTMKQIIRMPKS